LEGEHKVTGDEFNSRIIAINQHLTNLHTKTYENNKEFGEVYNALEALDKDYIAVILTSINAIEEVSKHMREEIDTIKEVQKKILENFQKFKQELKMDIAEISNESQMRHKSLSKELKKTQIISFVSIATTLILGILIVSKVL
jgi:gas vesicle protein